MRDCRDGNFFVTISRAQKERGKQIFKKKLNKALIKTQNFPYINSIEALNTCLTVKRIKDEQKVRKECNLAKENERKMSARIFSRAQNERWYFCEH